MENSNSIEQRSEEWFEQRRGKFTASEIHRLLGSANKNGTLGVATKKAIDSFAFEKAIEIVHGVVVEEIFSTDITRGVEQEPMAFELIKNKKALEFIDVESCGFFSYKESAGASPDGLIGSDAILEIKCPRRAKFFKTQIMDVEDIDAKYYDQMQLQMMSTGRKKASFVNYYIENGVEFYSEINVPLDTERADFINERLDIATAIRDAYVNKLRNPKNK